MKMPDRSRFACCIGVGCLIVLTGWVAGCGSGSGPVSGVDAATTPGDDIGPTDPNDAAPESDDAPATDTAAEADAGPIDPLGLADCVAPAPSLIEGTELLLPSAVSSDEHAVMCALRAIDTEATGKAVFCSAENDHGVRESFIIHALIARYLVHQHGVRTILVEAPAANIEPWDRYLATGDPDDLDLGLSDFGGTLLDIEEALQLVQELRAIREELPAGDSLRLSGFDVSIQTGMTIDALLGYLAVVEPTEVATWDSALKSSNSQSAAQSAAQLLDQLRSRRDAYVAASDEPAWLRAETNAANLSDGLNFLTLLFAGKFLTGNATYREPGMIRNVESELARLEPGTGLLVISHNWHCARSVSAGIPEGGGFSPALGTYLAASAWGSRYLVIGQIYEAGEHLGKTTFGLGTSSFEAPADSLEVALGQATTADALLVGTDSAIVSFASAWPLYGHPTPVVPREQFDALVYVRQVAATTPR
ncbi:MAG: erythromycin esterase family protein [Deltaproteobacteria bacterium]|nr:erythromycin esterase family protein [Deltaproteobacteria bacterium]